MRTKLLFRGTLVVAGVSVLTDAAVPEFSKLAAPNPAKKRINIVYVADGYTQDQRPLFLRMAARSMQTTLGTEPYRTYMRFLNFYSVWAPSNETGISNSQVTVDNYWGSRRGSLCVSIGRESQLQAFLDSVLPEWTVGILFYRDDAKRGEHTCAARITKTPDRVTEPGSFVEAEQCSVVIHELGHILSGLGDEHELLCGGGKVRRVGLGKRDPTVSVSNTAGSQTTYDKLPWKAWVDPSTPIPTPDSARYRDLVGAFAAAPSCGGFLRPQYQCKMRNLYNPYCVVCREGVVLSLYQYWGPVDSFAPAPGAMDVGGMSVVKAVPVNRQAPMRATWTLDGTAIPGQASLSLDLGQVALTQGTHALTCLVEDTTSWVRIYKGTDLLKSTASWALNVTTSTAAPVPALSRASAPSPAMWYLPNGRLAARAAASAPARRGGAPEVFVVQSRDRVGLRMVVR